MPSKPLIAALALFAAACGTTEPADQNTSAPAQSDGQRALHKLNDVNRAIALKRAIHASGIQCQRIDRSGYVREMGNLSMWAAACNDGRGWGLFVGRDDSVQVRDCKTMVSLKLPRCPEWAETAQRSR